MTEPVVPEDSSGEPSQSVTSEPFRSVYGQLMSLSARLDEDQMAALRELDGTLLAAETVMAGTPVGAGAHSTICGFIMMAYAAGRKAERKASGG